MSKSYQELGPVITLPASGDLSASLHCAMTQNVDGEAVLPAAGAAIVGVLLDKPTAEGQAAPLQVTGIAPVIFSAITARNAYVKVDVAGKFLPAVTGNFAVGRAMTAGTVNGNGAVLLFGGAYIVVP